MTLHLMELTGSGSMHFSNIYQATLNDIFTTRERMAKQIRGDLSAVLHIGNTGSESVQ